MEKTLLLLTALAATPTFAQLADTEILNANDASAIISDEGFFFNDFQSTVHGYTIPAGSGVGTFYAASLWAGGLDANGQVHVTAPSNSSLGWRSSPIADMNSCGTVAYQTASGQSIWKVTRQEVDDHIAQYLQGGYIPVAAIADWPGNGDVSLGVADQFAPFVDQDGDGVYEPLDGDYPDFPGDQVVYVIQNDESYLPQPGNLGVELHMMFYQFNDNGYMGETTFLNARVFNRSTISYMDFRMSIYADFDIGYYEDDYFGSDVTNNMIYGYNGDAFDDTNSISPGYAANPPCQGIMALNHDLHASVTFNNGNVFPTAAPITVAEKYNIMRGLWADDSPMFYGGNGYNAGVTTTETKILFPGDSDPLGLATNGAIINDDWGEYNANGGSPNPPHDRRGVMSISRGDLPAGTSICADFAFVFNGDAANDPYQNVLNVRNIAGALQILYDNSSDFPCGNFTAFTPEITPVEFNVFPNPSYGDITVQITNSTDPVIIEVRDVSGRSVYSEISSVEINKIHLDLPAGIYQVIVQSPHSKVAKSLVVQ